MTPDQTRAAGAASAYLHREVLDVRATLDDAHAAGLHIPPAAAEAVRTIAALASAWGHNAQGKPAPTHDRAQLGLVRLTSR